MLKHLLIIATVALTATAAFAHPKIVGLENGLVATTFDSAQTGKVIHQQHHPHGATIFSNLTQPYNQGGGWGLSGGPQSQLGETLFLAEAFTPSVSTTAREIDVAVGWEAGNNGITVGLYSDNGGVPGTKLGSRPVTNLVQFGTSSTAVGVAKLKRVALTAGTQYWVTLTFSKKYANETAAWNTTLDNDNTINAAFNLGSGWEGTQFQPAGAFAVYH
jgi:hypothetical protein